MNEDLKLGDDLDADLEEPIDEVEEDTRVGVFTHTYRPAFKYEDKTYEKVSFDLGRLTGRDVKNINAVLKSKAIYPLSRRFDMDYQALYAVKASSPTMSIDAFWAQPAKDFEIITSAVQNFLTH